MIRRLLLGRDWTERDFSNYSWDSTKGRVLKENIEPIFKKHGPTITVAFIVTLGNDQPYAKAAYRPSNGVTDGRLFSFGYGGNSGSDSFSIYFKFNSIRVTNTNFQSESASINRLGHRLEAELEMIHLVSNII